MRQIVLALCAAFTLLPPGPAGADQRPRSPQPSADGSLSINKVYFDLAVRTGGEFSFWAPGEFAMDSSRGVLGDPSMGKGIANRHGDISPGGRVEVAVPIDPSVGIVRFFAGIQKKDFLELRRPDGRVAASGQYQVERNETRHMLIVNVSDPEPGVWMLVVAGQGIYQATAQTRKRPPDDQFFRFVHVAGRPGHQGLFKVDRLPAAGTEAMCWASPHRDLVTAAFTFEGADGALLERLELAKRAPSDEFLGGCRVPREPFRFVARGVDTLGRIYEQRTAVMNAPTDR